GSRLYLVGGVAGLPDRSVLVRRALVLDLAHPRRWHFAPGPTGREHLAVTAAAGGVYAIGGRSAGYDTNSTLVESWRPGDAAWQSATWRSHSRSTREASARIDRRRLSRRASRARRDASLLGGPDVLVDAERVLRVVRRLGTRQPLVVPAVRRLDPLLPLVHHE